jgi:hypothetical protein
MPGIRPKRHKNFRGRMAIQEIAQYPLCFRQALLMPRWPKIRLGDGMPRQETIIGVKLSPNGWKHATRCWRHTPMRRPCFPIGLYLLIGAIAGHGRYVRRARIAFFLAAGITLLVVAFLIVQHIADNNHGKVFGIQIGFRLDRQDARGM